MYIKNIRIKNFKKFKDNLFEFNETVNILVGDNDSGKTTILEAIELAANCSYRNRPLSNILSSDLFNAKSINNYVSGDKSYESLPEILIELYLSELPEYRGMNNSQNIEADGLFIKICFDEELISTYNHFISSALNLDSIPIEFYKIEWYSFGWDSIKYVNRKVRGLFIDPTRLHPTYGKTHYLSNIINSALSKPEQALLNLNYRQLKNSFGDQQQVKDLNSGLDNDNKVTESDLSIVVDTTVGAVESGLQLAVNDILFSHIGKGEQNKIQIKLALLNKGGNAGFVMIEEPENHLSHTNLSKLIKFISDNCNSQVFITTHSSYVLNKLSLDNLCLLADGYLRLRDVDPQTAKTLQRLPGYDTLRIVLSKKVILVEGPSDELLLKKIYLDKESRLPEEDGIDIIVVRGIGFKHYLKIAEHIETKVHVVKDNDGSYDKNINKYSANYKNFQNIKFYSDEDDLLKSLEPSLIAANGASETSLDDFAKIALSPQAFNKLIEKPDLKTKKEYFTSIYIGTNGDKNNGSKKVDTALRIFESSAPIKFPSYLEEALNFD